MHGIAKKANTANNAICFTNIKNNLLTLQRYGNKNKALYKHHHSAFPSPYTCRALDETPGKAVELKLKADKYMAHEQFSEALTTYTRALELARKQNDSHTAAAWPGKYRYYIR